MPADGHRSTQMPADARSLTQMSTDAHSLTQMPADAHSLTQGAKGQRVRALRARAMYAKLTEATPRHWRIVAPADMERGRWYDFMDEATGWYGQCKQNWARDTGWYQEPRGDAPTILEYLKGGRHDRPV